MLLILLIMAPVSVYAEDFKVIKNNAVEVRFEEHLDNAARKVIGVYPSVSADLGKRFGWEMDLYPTVILMRSSKKFRKLAGNDMTVAFAVPSRYLIVIDYSKMETAPFTLETTLKHELCHLLLHHHISPGYVPRWVDEGVCQWASDGLAEIIMDPQWSPLKEAALSGRFLSIENMSSFPQERKPLLLAYEESRSLIEFIVAEYGAKGLITVLEQLREGETPERGIEKGLSISLSELEAKWQGRVKKGVTWFTYISSNLYEMLFVIAGLVTVCGFIKVLKRKREYKDEDGEEKDEGVESKDEG